MKKQLTQSDFAQLCGVNKSSVSRAISRGRLELVDGAIEVEAESGDREALEAAALELWIGTASSKPHHQARLQQIQEQREKRRQVMAGAPDDAGDADEATLTTYNLRIKRADAKKREEEARTAEINRLALEGNYLMRESVQFAMRDYTAVVNMELENLADRLAPTVHPLETVEEAHAAIAREIDRARINIHRAMQKAMDATKEQ